MSSHVIFFKKDSLDWNKFWDLTPNSSDGDVIKYLTDFYSICNHKAEVKIDWDNICITLSELEYPSDDQMNLVTKYAHQWRYSEVRVLLNWLIREYPLYSDLYRLYGQSYYDQWDFDNAKLWVLKSLKFNPLDVRSMLLLWNIYYKEWELEMAYKIMKDAYEINPEDKYLLSSYWWVCVALWKYFEARVIAIRLDTIDPWNPAVKQILDIVNSAEKR